jgi:hypothetical protein
MFRVVLFCGLRFQLYVYLCMFCVVDFVVQILCCRSSVAGIFVVDIVV